MKRPLKNSPKARTSKPSKERTGIDRLYKRTGARKVSYYYQYPDGNSETLATAELGNRTAMLEAERIAKRRALDIQQGRVIAGTVGEMISKFEDEVAPKHYLDQSKDGIAVRASGYRNLKAFFGSMSPKALRTIHGYQFLEARAQAGAPAKANKELSLMSTICHYAVRWGLIEANPFVDMMLNKTEKVVRDINRSQVVRFYLWSRKQTQPAQQTMGCAAMFAYLTGFRPSEVRPYMKDQLLSDGAHVVSAKRKKGHAEVTKVRQWSPRLHTVVIRAKEIQTKKSDYLFPSRAGTPYTRSGWGAQWSDVQFEWIASFDPEVAAQLAMKKEWESKYIAARRDGNKVEDYDRYKITAHPAYFSLKDVRPAAITTKLAARADDAYDFAAHANPATTHRHYDRRKVKTASATE